VKADKTRRNNIDTKTGKTMEEIRIEKLMASRCHKDENGLTPVDKGFINAKKLHSFHNSNLYYQGSFERTWLENLKNKFGLDWVLVNVKRGPTIKYIHSNGKTRNYFSDFLIGNTIYEIKSSWTWDRNGIDVELRQINENKLNAAKAAGYRVILIKDHTQIDW